jgi:hypothetical protein
MRRLPFRFLKRDLSSSREASIWLEPSAVYRHDNNWIGLEYFFRSNTQIASP